MTDTEPISEPISESIFEPIFEPDQVVNDDFLIILNDLKNSKKIEKEKEKANNDAIDDDFQDMLNDLKTHKKKEKKEKKADKAERKQKEKQEMIMLSDREMYKMHLENIYKQLEQNNPDLIKRKTLAIPIPKVFKLNGDKIVITNFGDICKTLNRDSNHVILYMEAELVTSTRMIDSKLVIKGVFKTQYIQTLIGNYIIAHVSCTSCNSTSTKISKIDRLSFVVCNICNSSRTLIPIKKGYSAVTKYTK